MFLLLGEKPMTTLQGVVPVIPIPFLEDESVDVAALRRAVEWAAVRKLGGICLPAFGSEFYKLSDAEREQVVGIAIEESRGRVPVVAQANHGSAKVAAGLAQRYERIGADFISVTVPRQFAVTELDLLHFCGRVADATSRPVLLQDFNPGGPTVDVDFMATLTRQHPNVRYLKIEEPMLVEKLSRLRDGVGDRVGVLSGWGGIFVLETLTLGGVGIMPGLAIADMLDRICRHCINGQFATAEQLFARVLPYLTYALQNLEAFLQAEKRLLVRRRVFDSDRCRQLNRTLSPAFLQHLDKLVEQMLPSSDVPDA